MAMATEAVKPIGTSLAELIRASGRSPREQAEQTTVLTKRCKKTSKNVLQCRSHPQRSFDCRARNDGTEPILWKNNVLRVQKVRRWTGRECLSDQALRVCCGAGKIFASLRRFWAVAARRNSSFAPHGPRSRSLPRAKMRLR